MREGFASDCIRIVEARCEAARVRGGSLEGGVSDCSYPVGFVRATRGPIRSDVTRYRGTAYIRWMLSRSVISRARRGGVVERRFAAGRRLVGGVAVAAMAASCGASGASVPSSLTVSASFTPIAAPRLDRCVRLLSPGSGEVWARARCVLVAGRPWFRAVVSNPFDYEIMLDCGLVARDPAGGQLFAGSVSLDLGRVAGHATRTVDAPVWLNASWTPAPAVTVSRYQAICGPRPSP